MLKRALLPQCLRGVISLPNSLPYATLQEEVEQTLSEVKISVVSLAEENLSTTTGSISALNHPESLADSVEQLRRAILQRRADIEALQAHQRKVMVPMEVYQCMVQCVQSAEVELQKQTKNLEV